MASVDITVTYWCEVWKHEKEHACSAHSRQPWLCPVSVFIQRIKSEDIFFSVRFSFMSHTNTAWVGRWCARSVGRCVFWTLPSVNVQKWTLVLCSIISYCWWVAECVCMHSGRRHEHDMNSCACTIGVWLSHKHATIKKWSWHSHMFFEWLHFSGLFIMLFMLFAFLVVFGLILFFNLYFALCCDFCNLILQKLCTCEWGCMYNSCT